MSDVLTMMLAVMLVLMAIGGMAIASLVVSCAVGVFCQKRLGMSEDDGTTASAIVLICWWVATVACLAGIAARSWGSL